MQELFVVADSKLDQATFATEAELLQQFDVSRPTLREGIRILESQGVLEQRPGPVAASCSGAPASTCLPGLSVYLRFNDVPFVTVLQAREVIEPALGRAAGGATTTFAKWRVDQRMKALGDDQTAFTENASSTASSRAPARGKLLETFWARSASSRTESITACALYDGQPPAPSSRRTSGSSMPVVKEMRARPRRRWPSTSASSSISCAIATSICSGSG